MPRPRLTCAKCARPMWASSSSLPQGEATCHPCRRAANPPRVSDHPVGPRTPRLATCATCTRLFNTDMPTRKYCSDLCRSRRGNRVKRTSTTTERNAWRSRQRGTTTQRGLGSDHQRRRAALLPAAIGTRCPIAGPRCDGIMTNPKRMDLDHSTPRVLGGQHGDRITCSPCNRSTGATLGNRLRGRRHGRRRSVMPDTDLPRW